MDGPFRSGATRRRLPCPASMKTVGSVAVCESLESRLRSISTGRERRWGSLTPHEMLCHLGDATAMVLGTRPRKGSPPVRTRRVIKLLGLWSPIRWPHGWPTNAMHDPRREGTRPSQFDADLARAIEGIRGIAAAPPGSLTPVHGFFGTMSVHDWQRWAYKHTDHHLRQFGA